MDRAQEVMDLCQERGWQVIVGIEDDKKEDISDVEKLLNPAGKSVNTATAIAAPKLGRNAPCLCGSGLKYKRCCGR
jgi:uncharacterized protein YchJ